MNGASKRVARVILKQAARQARQNPSSQKRPSAESPVNTTYFFAKFVTPNLPRAL
jgi:hypothetical protein